MEVELVYLVVFCPVESCTYTIIFALTFAVPPIPVLVIFLIAGPENVLPPNPEGCPGKLLVSLKPSILSLPYPPAPPSLA